jgi:hypothetical protein
MKTSEDRTTQLKASAAIPAKKCFAATKVTSKKQALVAEEMQELLTKLKDLVPNMPRNKKLSKLEIIQYVIDYIYDLETTLEHHPAAVAAVASSAFGLQNHNSQRGPLAINNASLNIVSSNPLLTPPTSATTRQPLSTLSICVPGEAML